MTNPPERKNSQGFSGLGDLASKLSDVPPQGIAAAPAPVKSKHRWLVYLLFSIFFGLVVVQQATSNANQATSNANIEANTLTNTPSSEDAKPVDVVKIIETSTPVAGSANAPPSVVLEESFWVVGSDAFVYSSPDKASKYTPLAQMTKFSNMVKIGDFYEGELKINGTLYKAFFLASDIIQGSEEKAKAEAIVRRNNKELQRQNIEKYACMATVKRPISGQLLSGKWPDIDDDHWKKRAETHNPAFPHEMMFYNGSQDTLVKIKQNDGVVVTFYLWSNENFKVGLPDGDYTVDFSIGKDYSVSCDKFMTNMKTAKDPDVQQLNSDGGIGETISYDLQEIQNYMDNHPINYSSDGADNGRASDPTGEASDE